MDYFRRLGQCGIAIDVVGRHCEQDRLRCGGGDDDDDDAVYRTPVESEWRQREESVERSDGWKGERRKRDGMSE